MGKNAIAGGSTAARLVTDQASARRIAALLGETLDPTTSAASAFEQPDGSWGVALHFRIPPRQAEVRALVALIAGPAAATALAFETVPAKDWVKASLAGLPPVAAGRFLVHGSHDRGWATANRSAIEIDAGPAFGTGHHGTTRGCLLALDQIVKRTHPSPFRGGIKRVLDLGTGSGVLAIAAAKSLHARVLATDVDPRAVQTARDNARRNRISGRIQFTKAAGANAPSVCAGAPFDLIFANILLGPLQRLAQPLSGLLAPNAHLVLSGLLAGQRQAALSPYRAQGLILERAIGLQGWVTLVLRRPAALRF
jgi:ribosomal protein L11 methyltransferase